ncbi:MAG: DNA-binding domain-containing protein [Pseudomonadota bacterium]
MSAVNWARQQQVFATVLLDADAPTPEFLRARDGALLPSRFDVYRNNVHASLTDALRAVFPVTTRLVGEEFFRALAREFLRHNLPRGAALHDYGADLPDFIRGHAPAAELPYLADVAALEHAWWQAYGAAEAPAVSLAELAAIDGEQLLALRARLHPAVRMLNSVHPMHGIWFAHQADDEPVAPESWQAEAALITRPDATVQVRGITPAAHAFFVTLGADATLESAASAALELDPAFDLGATLLLAIQAGAIQELYP